MVETKYLIKNFKAVLFDLDGVVVFTDKYHYLAWKRLADEQGWDFDKKINNYLRGVPRLDSLEIILSHNNVQISDCQKEELASAKNNYYVEMLDSISLEDMYPGVFDFIKMLRDLGLKTALCSSSKNARKVLDKLGLTCCFDAVVTGSDIVKAKPHPEIFLAASDLLAVHPLNCLVFEDAESGIEAAIAAGMRNVGVGQVADLPKADCVINDYGKIDVQALIETGFTEYPFEIDQWSIRQRCFGAKFTNLSETCFTLSNGYMGVRGALEENYEQNKPGVCVSGFHEKVSRDKYWFDEPEYFQTTANHYDWRSIKLFIDGVQFSLLEGNVLSHERILDFKKGVLTRKCHWESLEGNQVIIETERFVSFKKLNIAAIRYKVIPVNFSGLVKIVSEVNFYQPVSLTKTSVLDVLEKQIEKGIFVSRYSTKKSKLEGGFVCGHSTNLDFKGKNYITEDSFVYEAEFELAQGQELMLDKHICLFTSLDTDKESLLSVAKEHLEHDLQNGFDKLRDEHVEFWQNFWSENDIKIEGSKRDQGAIRFNIFQLKQAHNEKNVYSIPANGLTGDHFMGLIFWDTDVYVQPYYAYTNPEMAKQISNYRYNTLEQARQKAKLMRGKGAKYPWTTIDGHESSCNPTVGPCQYHINGDVVFAIWRYVTTSGDKEFLYEKGAEIIFESARFWADLGHYIEDGLFFIDFVTGPDEFNYIVNNDFYTNMLAKFNWQFAIDTAKDMQTNASNMYKAISEKIDLQNSELEEWQRLIEKIYLPYNKNKGIWEQDDAFVNRKPVDISNLPENYGQLKKDYTLWDLGRRKIIKQPSVVLIEQMLHYQFDIEQKKRDYDYYQPLTTHGSSLSPAIHSITASELGYKQEAYRFFRNSAFLDVCDFRRNTCNGLHYACIGSVWMTIVNGFAGMRDDGNKLCFNRRLPESWNSLEFGIAYKGCFVNIFMSNDKVKFRLLKGQAFDFEFEGKKYFLNAQNNEIEMA